MQYKTNEIKELLSEYRDEAEEQRQKNTLNATKLASQFCKELKKIGGYQIVFPEGLNERIYFDHQYIIFAKTPSRRVGYRYSYIRLNDISLGLYRHNTFSTQTFYEAFSTKDRVKYEDALRVVLELQNKYRWKDK